MPLVVTYTAATSAAGARCSNRREVGERGATAPPTMFESTARPQLALHASANAHNRAPTPTPHPHTREAHRGCPPAHLHKLDAVTDVHSDAGVVKAHRHVGEELFRHLGHHAARMEGTGEVSREA